MALLHAAVVRQQAGLPPVRPDQHGLPVDYGQSLPNSVHPHVSTPAEVASSRARPDPLAGVLGTVGGLVGPVARDIARTPGDVGANLSYLLGARKTAPQSRMESGVFYPSIALALGKFVTQDFSDPAHHKLNLALDVAALGSGGASIAGRLVKAERALKEGQGIRAAARAVSVRPLPQEVLPRGLVGDAGTGTRKVRVEGGSVQPLHQSPSIPTALAQHAFDRLSERVPGVPLVGAKARARRIIPEAQSIRDRRAVAEVADLQHAARTLRSPLGGTSAKEAAYSAIADFGHGPEGVKLLDADVARREARLAALPAKIEKGKAKLATLEGDAAKAQASKVAALEHELKLQPKRIAAWKAAREYVADPSKHPDLQRALVLGEAASKQATASRVARGKITAETAAKAENRKARIASGARYVKPTPGRLGKESVALKRARGRVASLQGRFDRLDAPREVSRRLTRAQAEQRVASIEQTYNELVDKIAGGYEAKSARAITASRNVRNSRVDPARRVPTVKAEARKYAEAQLTRRLEENKHPSMQRLNRLLDEANSLRARLEQHVEGRAFGGQGITNFGSATETARGGARRDRIGGALSVAKDELSRLEKAAATRIEQTGLVGAEKVTAGPGHFNVPDVERRGQGRGVRVRSVNRPKDRAHQSTGVLFRTGRNRLGPQVTIEDALKETRYHAQAEDARVAESFSRPFNRETFDPRKQVLLNPQGAKLPRYLLAEDTPLELASSTPREIAQHWLDNRTAWARNMFPASVEEVPAEHRLGLRMIDKQLAEAITGRDRYYAMVNRGKLGRLLDLSNNLNRAALIYLNPSYIPKNFTGNLAFLALQQGPFAANNLIRASQHMGNLSPETLRWVSGEAGGGAAIQLAHEGRGFLAAPLQKVADIQGAGADRLPRIAAWLYEADRRGYRTEQQIAMLRSEQRLRPVLNEISEAANQAMVKFSRAPTAWRRVASRALFIFPWVEGSTRYVGRLALDRPLAARAAQEVRQHIEKLQRQVFGEGKRITGGRIPLGVPYSKFGTRVVRSFNPMALSPIGQAFEVGHAIGNAATGNWRANTQLLGFAQPSITAALEAGTGIDTYRGQRYPKGTSALDILKQNLIGSSSHPAIPLADVAATALRKPQPLNTAEPPLHQPNYIPEAGPVAALWKLMLGSARPTVEVNLPAVQAKGMREKLADLSPVKRSYQSVFERRNAFYKEMRRLNLLENGRMPKPLRDAFNLEAERQGLYARVSNGLKQGTIEYQRARFVADATFLARYGQVPSQEARQMVAWAKTQTDIAQLQDARRYVSEHYYQDKDNGFLTMIAESRRYLEKHGAPGLGQ